MANNPVVILALRFVLLVLAQALVFNDLGFWGFINPMIYVLFIYWYPLQNNRTIFLMIGFVLGITIDLFSDSMALHTAATVTAIYIRPFLVRFCFGANFEPQGFGLKNVTRLQRYALLALIVGVHHLVYFSLEIFSFAHFLLILKKLFFISLGTLVVGVLIHTLFSREGNY